MNLPKKSACLPYVSLCFMEVSIQNWATAKTVALKAILLSTIGGLVLFVSPTPQKNVPAYASIRFGLLLKTSKRF